MIHLALWLASALFLLWLGWIVLMFVISIFVGMLDTLFSIWADIKKEFSSNEDS